jgi:two-component system aerobic respiration control sensor histidine kinase ArcB
VELGTPPVRIDAPLPESLPLPAGLLRMLFRNLIGNAVAAGAARVTVTASRSDAAWTLRVSDDGVGLGAATYGHGSGLGLTLCRRALERLDGSLDLGAPPSGGTVVLATFRGGN